MRKFLACLALAALAACGAPAPKEPIQSLAAKAAKGDLAAAEALLERLGSGYSVDERALAYKSIIEAGKKAGPIAMKAVGDADQVRREHALALATNLGAEGIYDAAVAALTDRGFERNHSAAWALGEIGDERAIPVLADALASARPGLTARESARALEKFGVKSVSAIVSRVPSMNPEVKGYAIRILGEIRDPAGRHTVIDALADPKLRADALWALGTMGPSERRLEMTPYLRDADALVRVEACRTTGLLGEKSALPVLDSMRSSDPVIVVREWAARGMGLLTGEAEKYRDKTGEWKAPDMIYH